MNTAYKVRTWDGGTTVIHSGTSVMDDSKNAIISIQSGRSDVIADGIIRMLNEDQCPACGKFNGLHGEIFHGQSDSFGSVNGHYEMCPNAKGKK